MLQGTKYTALCSFSIGFYSIEIEQTAYRNILSLQLRSHPQLLLTSVKYFMIKKIRTDEMRNYPQSGHFEQIIKTKKIKNEITEVECTTEIRVETKKLNQPFVRGWLLSVVVAAGKHRQPVR